MRSSSALSGGIEKVFRHWRAVEQSRLAWMMEFRVLLYAESTACPFESCGLDNRLEVRPGFHDQVATDLAHALMVDRADLRYRPIGIEFRKRGLRCNANFVGLSVVGLFVDMRDRIRVLCANVLVQGAAEGDIDPLQAATNAAYRFVNLDAFHQEFDLEIIPDLVATPVGFQLSSPRAGGLTSAPACSRRTITSRDTAQFATDSSRDMIGF